LRIPGDGRLSQKEFEINPSSAVLKAKGSMNIEVVFIPLIPKTYDMVMVIDLDGIG
jgi:hydrocephalus-inducing protein